MTEPNKDLLADENVPTITLAGKKWPVPVLAPRQNRRVTPLILKVMPDLRGLTLEKLVTVLSEERLSELYEISYLALTRGHPDLKREEFEDMPIGSLEVIASVITIARQTGTLKPADPSAVPLAPPPAA